MATPSPGSGLLTLGEAVAVADGLRAGGLAVLPTETGYLLAASASSVPAVLKAFAVKGRSPSNPMHVACSSLAMAETVGRLDPRAERLLGMLTPGPLSVVVPQTDRLDNPYVTLNGTIGLRVPDNAATLQVIAALGVPVTATSLNRSGSESEPVDRRVLESFDWHGEQLVHAVVDPASIRHDRASTLVRLTGADLEILREGPVGRDTVEAALG
jgi:L-threonylcarbamoyladenylate synthase